MRSHATAQMELQVVHWMVNAYLKKVLFILVKSQDQMTLHMKHTLASQTAHSSKDGMDITLTSEKEEYE